MIDASQPVSIAFSKRAPTRTFFPRNNCYDSSNEYQAIVGMRCALFTAVTPKYEKGIHLKTRATKPTTNMCPSPSADVKGVRGRGLDPFLSRTKLPFFTFQSIHRTSAYETHANFCIKWSISGINNEDCAVVAEALL